MHAIVVRRRACKRMQPDCGVRQECFYPSGNESCYCGLGLDATAAAGGSTAATA